MVAFNMKNSKIENCGMFISGSGKARAYTECGGCGAQVEHKPNVPNQPCECGSTTYKRMSVSLTKPEWWRTQEKQG